MKQNLMMFGLAYALGVGTVLLVQYNSPRLPVCELPIPTFAGELPIPAFATTTITGFASPQFSFEFNPVKGDSSCVTDCESESDGVESVATGDDVIFVHTGSAFSLDLIDDISAKQPEPSESDKDDSKSCSSKDE